jgi:hypothetical protein
MQMEDISDAISVSATLQAALATNPKGVNALCRVR